MLLEKHVYVHISVHTYVCGRAHTYTERERERERERRQIHIKSWNRTSRLAAVAINTNVESEPKTPIFSRTLIGLRAFDLVSSRVPDKYRHLYLAGCTYLQQMQSV